jgi:putative ABC transport system permease protein
MLTFVNALPGAVAQGLIWGLMAVGVYITYKVLDVADLTVDGSICTGAVVFSVALIAGIPAPVAMIFAFLAGVAAGFVTGLFHTLLGIPAILSGILTQLILWSVNLKVLGKANVAIPSRSYSVIITQLNIPMSLIVLAGFTVVIALVLYWFFGTELGCAIRATGNNQNMSRAQGINTSLIKVLGLMLSNGIVALSGALLCQYQGFTDINMGRGAIVIGLAAVIIGGAIVSKLSRNFLVQLLSCAIGGVVYYIVYQLVIALGFDTDLLKALSAAVVAIFLSVPYFKKTYFSKVKLAKNNGNSYKNETIDVASDDDTPDLKEVK